MSFLTIIFYCLFLIIGLFINEVQPQFVRDCNAPEITIHLPNNQHTYCNHACSLQTGANPAPNTGFGAAICTAGGYCQCPCDATLPQSMFDNAWCPPPATDLAETDPTWRPRCVATCGALCVGGTGEICGTLAGESNAAKICVCICPRDSCPPNVTTTTTTTTVAPTAVASTSLIILPIPWFLKLKWLVKTRLAQLYLQSVLGLGVTMILFCVNFTLIIICEALSIYFNRPILRYAVRVLRLIREYLITGG